AARSLRTISSARARSEASGGRDGLIDICPLIASCMLDIPAVVPDVPVIDMPRIAALCASRSQLTAQPVAAGSGCLSDATPAIAVATKVRAAARKTKLSFIDVLPVTRSG